MWGCQLSQVDNPHGHKQLLTFLTLLNISLFSKSFLAIFIVFWCKYKTTISILQIKNTYMPIIKTYTLLFFSHQKKDIFK